MTHSTRLNLIACLIIFLLLSCACARAAQESDTADSPSNAIEIANAEQSEEDNVSLDAPPNAAVLCTAEGRDQLWFWNSRVAQWQLWEMVQLQESAILPQALLPLAGAPDELVMIGARIDEAGKTGLFIVRWRDGQVQWSAENEAASYTPNLNQLQTDTDALYAIDSADPPNMVRLNYAACARGECMAEPVTSVTMANQSGTHTLVWDIVSGGLSVWTGDGANESLATTAYAAQWLNDNQLIYLDAERGDSAGANRLMLRTVDEEAVQLVDRDQVQELVGETGSLVDAHAAGSAVLVALGDAVQPTTFAAVLVNVETGQATHLTDLSVAEWNAVQLAPSGLYAAIGRNDELDLFDLATGQVVSSYAIPGGQSQIADFSADGRWLLALTSSGVEIIELETLEAVDSALPDMEPLGRVCSIGVFVDRSAGE